MSDAPAEGAKKKGGKMPMMIAVVAILGGGGYFMMGKKEAPKKEPELELGGMISLGESEIITNLVEREYFLRTKIAVQLDKNAHFGHGGGGDGHGKGGPNPDELVLRQVAMDRLRTISIRDMANPEFGPKLRRLLAQDFNHAIHALHEEEEDSSKKKKKKDEEEKDSHAHAEAHGPKPGDLAKVDLTDAERPEWDSDEGPVLRVFFVELATMRE